jgi:hypothetical protein
MRPAYNTRCPECGIRLVVMDEWQYDKDKDGKTIKWFDPDRIIQQHIRKAH